ncbi:hypothetical protein GN244_ATG03421 [Phytophthora infestans]|uniref:Uncharacterized protein n=1 Tax=Phytophthora infestans TaxID=4787 RepID=A0A833SPU7_PHYIN|nr:hypothetical protein GN244_ATG03421 [Phytophthora infestans]
MSVASGVFVNKTVYSTKNDLRLVMKACKIDTVIKRVKSASHPIAHPILADDDLAFTDALGTTHNVEMPGKRTEEGILF